MVMRCRAAALKHDRRSVFVSVFLYPTGKCQQLRIFLPHLGNVRFEALFANPGEHVQELLRHHPLGQKGGNRRHPRLAPGDGLEGLDYIADAQLVPGERDNASGVALWIFERARGKPTDVVGGHELDGV